MKDSVLQWSQALTKGKQPRLWRTHSRKLGKSIETGIHKEREDLPPSKEHEETLPSRGILLLGQKG